MNIRDLEEVNFLNITLNALVKAKEQATISLAIIEESKETGAYVGFESGYSVHLSEFKDGSGKLLDMTGCYLALDLLEATLPILERKIAYVHTRFEALGVIKGTISS